MKMLLRLQDLFSQADSTGLFGALLLSSLSLVYFFYSRSALLSINGKKPFEVRYAHARKRFLADARNLISSGFAKVGSLCLQCKQIQIKREANHRLSRRMCLEFSPTMDIRHACPRNMRTKFGVMNH
jgi:hypothetical protein